MESIAHPIFLAFSPSFSFRFFGFLIDELKLSYKVQEITLLPFMTASNLYLEGDYYSSGC